MKPLKIREAKYMLNKFFAGLELLSYLRGRSSVVVTEAMLSVYHSQILLETGQATAACPGHDEAAAHC